MATINDVVLIYLEDNPVAFARVENIVPDHKKDWYQITLLMLQIPLQTVTWILKDDYINGGEFQMSGKKMRLETVKAPEETHDLPQEKKTDSQKEEPVDAQSSEPGQIISFADLKKKKHEH
ncbi:MAG TPA: hypothetical protein VJ959_13445 [Desulfotignum sp.]|nr:hypothetical protein [Desulfotignum sp.]